MPRKAFVADLQAAQVSSLPPFFSQLRPGDEDGSINITYTTPGFGSYAVNLQALVSDVSDYPSEHSFFVYSTSDPTPNFVVDALSDTSVFNGLKVSSLISRLARIFDEQTRGTLFNPYTFDDDEGTVVDAVEASTAQTTENSSYDDEDELQEGSDDDDDEEENGYDHFDIEADFAPQAHSSAVTTAGMYATAETREAFNARIRLNLRTLKSAGFRVSSCGSPFDFARDFYISISCRIEKLNISEDALAAWSLVPEKYIILAIHYTNGYMTMDEILAEAKLGKRSVSFGLAVCSNHKGARQDTIDLFSVTQASQPCKAGKKVSEDSPEIVKIAEGQLEKFFIDRPLQSLMNDRFIDVLRRRHTYNFVWDGAERHCNDRQPMAQELEQPYMTYYSAERVHFSPSPALRIADHFSSSTIQKSFPLIAMEFMLRHFVCCTDFCLVCHVKLDANFEALKPYVCSRPLCLFQYMSLGLGPSMEHEIVAQPSVVDLLVSFCHARASAGKLEDLPVGMGMSVPSPHPLLKHGGLPGGGMSFAGPLTMPGGALTTRFTLYYRVKYDERQNQVTVPATLPNGPGLKVGDWVTLQYVRKSTLPGLTSSISQQRKVAEVWDSAIKLAPTYSGADFLPHVPVVPTADAGPGPGVEAILYPFNRNFDDLNQKDQQVTICNMLDALPMVSQMRNALLGSRNKSLAQLFTDVAPAAFSILRWVIASNRSCIVAIDDASAGSINYADRVHGMSGYMQFRFAQGAPDKEQRFMEAVKKTQSRLNTMHPTLWAWHGSRIENWHSIIREGLHFKAVSNGRAYGDGIYNALDAATSTSYSNRAPAQARNHSTGNIQSSWLKSELNITSALSLNEIVNAPAEFQSAQPYLVVKDVDWVQTRVLCVLCNFMTDEKKHLQGAENKEPAEVLSQDPTYTPRGMTMEPLRIPTNIISASRRQNMSSISKGTKQQKVFVDESIELPASDVSSDEDQALTVDPPIKVLAESAAKTRSLIQTDFVPGSLDLRGLPRLPSPPYATSQASRALTRAVRELQKTQNSTPTAELGWHLCEEALDNIYQWIVELHTFDSSLPMAKDLKDKQLTSVVLELRFGPSFPFSPPFVRVIRPRFLSFLQGGGGHVTAGGALCMELLTNNGWSAVSSIEAVLLQVKMAISSTEPRPARLPPGPVGEYSAGEAIDAYKRACATHGWTVPPDFAHLSAT